MQPLTSFILLAGHVLLCFTFLGSIKQIFILEVLLLLQKVDLFHVKMPIIEPWVTSYGYQDAIDSVFVHLDFDVCDGWGECSPAPIPSYNSEYASGAFDIAHTVLGPSLCGKQLHSGADISECFQHIKGHQFAKSAFDCAWWDAFSKYKKQPLWKLIGGVNKTVSVGADFPVQKTSAELLSKVDQAVVDGFKRIKIKFNSQSNVATIAEIKSRYPDTLIHVDCNSGFSLDDIDLFKELDELALAMIEQPLAHDDLIFHAELQSKINTPICLDESITSIDRARKAIDIDACRYINIKTSRVGGLTNAIEIHDLCQDRGIPVWVGGMLESAVGQSFSLALATMPNVGYPNDIFPSRRFYQVDMSAPEIVLSSPGIIEAPRSLGAGFAPDFSKLVSKSVKSASINA